jgi:TonB family protein
MSEIKSPSFPPQKAGMSTGCGVIVLLLLVIVPLAIFLLSVYVIFPALESQGYSFFWQGKSEEKSPAGGEGEISNVGETANASDNDRSLVSPEGNTPSGNKPQTKGGVKPTTPTIDSGEGSAESNRTMMDLVEAIIRHNGELNQIYQQYLKQNPGLQGTVIVNFTIDPSGKVSNAYVVSSTLGNADMEQRIVSAIYSWYFPACPEGETQVTYPFVFSTKK